MKPDDSVRYRGCGQPMTVESVTVVDGETIIDTNNLKGIEQSLFELGEPMISNNSYLELLKQLVQRAGTQGNAARAIGVDVSTVKRYLNGTLTIPERKAHVVQVIMNLDDDAFQEATKKAEK